MPISNADLAQSPKDCKRYKQKTLENQHYLALCKKKVYGVKKSVFHFKVLHMKASV